MRARSRAPRLGQRGPTALARLAYGGVQGVTRLGGSVDGALALLAALNDVLGADNRKRLTCPKPVVGVEFHSHAHVGIRDPGQERIAWP